MIRMLNKKELTLFAYLNYSKNILHILSIEVEDLNFFKSNTKIIFHTTIEYFLHKFHIFENKLYTKIIYSNNIFKQQNDIMDYFDYFYKREEKYFLF